VPESNPSPESESPTPPTTEESATGHNSPGAGCIIMIVALASLSFLVTFGVWNLFQLDKELSKFTEPEPKPTALLNLEENAAAVNVLTSKIETFQTDHGNKREAVLTLSAEEINLAIAAFDNFKELRQTFSIKAITKDELHIEIAFPLRGSPTKGGFRYLNGTMVAKPDLTGGEIIFIVEHIDVPGKTVPDGFLGQLSPYRPAQNYLNDETLGPWMKRLTKISLGDGALSLTISPEEKPPAGEPKKIETSHIVRFAILLGAIFLGFIAVAIMAINRGKRMH